MKSTTYQFRVLFTALLAPLFLHSLGAQALRLPQNQNFSCSAGREVGVTTIDIQWNAPGVKGREGKIWGTQVAYYGFTVLGFGSDVESPWRAGADESTTISFSTDVTINGKPLSAGKYGFFIALYPDSSVLIFNKNVDGWGSYFYRKDLDVLRVTTIQQKNQPVSVERLAYNFYNQTDHSIEVALEWERWKIPFTVEINLKATTLAYIKSQMSGAIGFDAPSLQAAANWCVTNDVNLDEALAWVNNSVNPNFGGVPSFAAYSTKAQFTERGGKLYRLSAGGQPRSVTGVPPVLAEGQGGLLDVELHPKFAENNLIYLSYSKFRDSSGTRYNTTAVYRARLEGNRLVDGRDIFVATPWAQTTYHYGSRLEFDRSGYLFVSVGERGLHEINPQSLDSDCGKIHRMRDDGTAPADNPFVKSHPAHATIWSWGHRNPQGMTLNPETGEIWAHEHGPRGGDEVNRIVPGSNYGWPIISYGINYDGSILTNLTAKEGMEQPLKYWVPSIGPSGMVFVTGDRYPAWKGDLLVGSLKFKYLDRCIVRNGQITGDELLLQNLGRMRCVAMDRNGFLYVAVEEPGFIFKLVPVVQ